MKNILIVSSEAIPYIKTGGLADVAGSLPKYLWKIQFLYLNKMYLIHMLSSKIQAAVALKHTKCHLH